MAADPVPETLEVALRELAVLGEVATRHADLYEVKLRAMKAELWEAHREIAELKAQLNPELLPPQI